MDDLQIIMDELGRFWVAHEDGPIVSGPYDTPEAAQERYPDAELCIDE